MSQPVATENGLEVPVRDGCGGSATATVGLVKPSGIPPLKLKNPSYDEVDNGLGETPKQWAPKKPKEKIPMWGTPAWEKWMVRRTTNRLVAGLVRRLFPEDEGVCTDPVVLSGLCFLAEEDVAAMEPRKLTWAPKKEKKPRGISWFDEKYGMEKPVSSTLHFDKELPVY